MTYDVISVNAQTGERTERNHTQAEKDELTAMQPTTDEKWVTIRSQRDALLHETDWASLADSPAISDAMKTYRQNLRDIPSQSDVDNITWPDKP
jgi:hypothetical protein|tara:strand:- start:350 stop:631 length:282 start_codon:yes stop_codon:yes gene_type:complete